MPVSAWLPLQSAAGAFREECSSLDQLVQELFADLDRLGGELEAKADELEEGRRHLAERGRQLAEQRKESAQLSHQLEQQETRLSEALVELRELRAELANRPAPVSVPDVSAELETLRHQITELQVERAVLLERLEAAANQASQARSEPLVPQISVLSADTLRSLSDQFAEQFAILKQQLASPPNPSPAVDLESLKHELLQHQETQLTTALAELRQLRTELANRPESTPGESLESTGLRQQLTELQMERAVLLERLEALAKQPLPNGAPSLPAEVLESLNDQFAQQFLALQEQIQALHQNPPALTELDSLKQERIELELELELVRSRSAELQETVTHQKRELAAQRLEVNEELKELRMLIVDQAELLIQHEPEAASSEDVHEEFPTKEKRVAPPVSGHEETPAKSVDPVVNSVMAQFAKLQRDIAQRRKKK
jgi:SMC interacting uncharacterized protein involved in chromosome segregation